jgi:hypothetical protein
LSDLPVRHCATKPRHTFCTICYRINYNVAFDCPLRERPEEAQGPVAPTPLPPAFAYAQPGAAPVWPPSFPPPPPPEMPEGPVIEFAKTGEVPAKRRVKAKPSETRGPPPAPAPISQSTEDDLAAELKSWDPEASAAPLGFGPAPIVEDFQRRLADEEERKRTELGAEGNSPAPRPPPPELPTGSVPAESQTRRRPRRPRP